MKRQPLPLAMQAARGPRVADVPRLCIVGPLPPPAGGMANQCEQLVRLLRLDGIEVDVVRSNAPYRPAFIEHAPIVRAAFRLLPYLWALWRAAGRAQVFHLFANSGWAWHLFCAPVLFIARRRGVAVIVNYRGGQADAFFARAPSHVLRSLAAAALCVTPSPFLLRVFAKYGLKAQVIPNIVDLSRFGPVLAREPGDAPHLLVARHLEPIYDVATAIHALGMVRQRFPGATMTVAGRGPQETMLRALAAKIGLGDAVHFVGQVDNGNMPQLYARADCVVNSSRVDNMPIALLEAFASGLPGVSTDAGGIPDMVQQGVTGLLVGVGDAQALAEAICRVLQDRALARRLVEAARQDARKYSWANVAGQWLDAYRLAAARVVAQ